MMELVLGLGTGFLFGFLLQKAQVLRFEKQVGFLRLIDMTIIKFMFSAILVGVVGMYLCKDLGIISFKLKATHIGAQVIGGLTFGIGWSLFGYCPGTSIGAIGEGRWHALWGVIGMIVGAAVYAEIYPLMQKTAVPLGNYGKITIPEVLQVNHWLIIFVFIAMGLFLFFLFEKRKL